MIEYTPLFIEFRAQRTACIDMRDTEREGEREREREREREANRSRGARALLQKRLAICYGRRVSFAKEPYERDNILEEQELFCKRDLRYVTKDVQCITLSRETCDIFRLHIRLLKIIGLFCKRAL